MVLVLAVLGLGLPVAAIEHLNATFRRRLRYLARRTCAMAHTTQTVEAGMWLLGAVYNFCTVHHSLGTTPALAACLTDQLSSRQELLHFKVPTTSQPPKHRGRPGKSVGSGGLVEPP
jgi:hypothetical protein